MPSHRSLRSSSRGSTPRPTPSFPADSQLRGRVASRTPTVPTRATAFASRTDAGSRSSAPVRTPSGRSGQRRHQGSRLLGRALRRGLIAPGVINPIPEATLRAFADHGTVGAELAANAGAAEVTLREASEAGVDLEAITRELERAESARLRPTAGSSPPSTRPPSRRRRAIVVSERALGTRRRPTPTPARRPGRRRRAASGR